MGRLQLLSGLHTYCDRKFCNSMSDQNSESRKQVDAFLNLLSLAKNHRDE